MKRKRLLAFVLAFMMLFSNVTSIYAAEPEVPVETENISEDIVESEESSEAAETEEEVGSEEVFEAAEQVESVEAEVESSESAETESEEESSEPAESEEAESKEAESESAWSEESESGEPEITVSGNEIEVPEADSAVSGNELTVSGNDLLVVMENTEVGYVGRVVEGQGEQEGQKYLVLTEQDAMDQYGTIFTEEVLLNILDQYSSENQFTGIELDFYRENVEPSVYTEVSVTLWNKLVSLLRWYGEGDRWLDFILIDRDDNDDPMDNEFFMAEFVNPGLYYGEGDIISIGMNVDPRSKQVSFSRTDYLADDVWFFRCSMREDMAGMWSEPGDLHVMQGDEVKTTGYYGKGEEYRHGKVSINNIKKLNANQVYDLVNIREKEWLIEWNGIDGAEETRAVSYDEFASVLDSMEEVNNNEVKVSWCGEGNVDAIPGWMLKIFAENGKNLKFSWRSDEFEADFEWIFEGLSQEYEFGDYPLVDMRFSVREKENASFGTIHYIKLRQVPEIPACEKRYLNIWQEGLTQDFHILYSDMNGDYLVQWNEYGKEAFFAGVANADNDNLHADLTTQADEYSFADTYLGRRFFDEDNEGLMLSDWDVASGQLTSAQIVAILEYWDSMDWKFDWIDITYVDRTEKKLETSVAQAARRVLRSNNDSQLCLSYHTSDNTWSEHWRFAGLKKVTADIGLELEISVVNGNYTARRISTDSLTAENIQMILEGEEIYNLYGSNSFRLIAAAETAEGLVPMYPDDRGEYFYDEPGDDDQPGIGRLELHDVKDMVSGTVYHIMPIDREKSRKLIKGESYTLKDILYGEDEVSVNPTSVMGYSVDESVATVDADGLITGEDYGETILTFRYTENGVVKQDAYYVWVEGVPVEKIWFSKDEISMTLWDWEFVPEEITNSIAEEGRFWDEIDGHYSYEWLQINSTPTDGFDRGWLEFTVETDSEEPPVAEIWRVDEYNFAVIPRRAGTATIKMTYTPQYLEWNDETQEDVLVKDVAHTVTAECELLISAASQPSDWDGNPRMLIAKGADVLLGDVGFENHIDEEREYWSWASPFLNLSKYVGMDTYYLEFPALYQPNENVEAMTHMKGVEFREFQERDLHEIHFEMTEEAVIADVWYDGDVANCTNADDFGLAIEVYVNDRLKYETQHELSSDGFVRLEYAYDEGTINAGDSVTIKVTLLHETKIISANGVPVGAGYTDTDMVWKQTLNLSGEAPATIFTEIQGEPTDGRNYGSEVWYDLNNKNTDADRLAVYSDREIKKVTWSSSNTSVIAVGKTQETGTEERYASQDEEPVVFGFVKIPYTVKSAGNAVLTANVTLMDGTKETVKIQFHALQPEINISTTDLTVNTKSSEGFYFDIFTENMAPENVFDQVLILDKNGSLPIGINVERIYEEGAVTNSFRITAAKDAKIVSKQNYKVRFKYCLDSGCDQSECNDYKTKDIAVKFTVTDKMPAAKLTWETKVNPFYYDNEGAGLLKVNVPGEKISSIEWDDLEGNCQYYVCGCYSDENGADLEVALKGDGNKKAKNAAKAKVYIWLEGYTDPIVQNVTVSVKEVKPTFVLSSTSETLYPKFYEDFQDDAGAGFYIYHKTDGYTLRWDEGMSISVDTKSAKNYRMRKVYQGDWIEFKPRFDSDDVTLSRKSTKITLEVKMPTWTQSLKFNYTIKCNTSKPVLKLGTSTLKLNANANIARNEYAYTSLGFKDSTIWQGFWENDIQVTGNNKAAREALNKTILINWNGHEQRIEARFNDKNIPDPGIYQYRVWVNVAGAYKISTILNVQVYDAEPSVQLKKSGSIDSLLPWEETMFFNPTVKNISGNVEYAYLTGEGSEFLEARLSDDGKTINVCSNGRRMDKDTYSVQVVVGVHNGYTTTELVSPEQSIKVTQGKPKVNFEVYGGVWYNSDNADLSYIYDSDSDTHQFKGTATWINVWSDLKGYNVPIDNVQLVNYQNDFEVYIPDDQYDDDGVNGLELRRIGYDEVLKDGTYTLKFKVVYRNKIGTKTADVVTMKLVLK